MDKTVMVSIWCITYNHELYIRDAIEGFLNQKTDFHYEIIIHDDASTDNTANIIREYEIKYPTMIHGIYQVENQYKKNQPSMEWIQKIHRENCKGKYIALCEGDDYWIDPYKLQIQIDYMERHPECVMTAHNAVNIDYKSGDIKARNSFEKEGDLTAKQVIMQSRGHMPTASIVYKKEISEMDGFFLEVGIGDYPIELYSFCKGVIHYFDRIMSVYRFRHDGSYDEDLFADKRKFFIHCIGLVAFLERYNRYTARKFEKYVVDRQQGFIDEMTDRCTGKIQEFIRLCRECDKESGYRVHEYIEEIIRVYSLLFDDEFLGEKFQAYCEKCSRIYIMGAGYYAGIIARKFDKYGIKYQGFVVSNNQKCEEKYLGRNVRKFNELVSDLKDSSFVIGINPRIWSQIIEQLEEANIDNYYAPFRINVE